MNINAFNNLRFEYSVGANVIILSLIDTSKNRDVLIEDNASKIIIEYTYNDIVHFIEKDLSFHINSIIIFIDDLPESTDIEIKPYISFIEDSVEKYRVQITDTIYETTLPYGNIDYELISSNNTEQDKVVENKIKEVLSYINKLGAYVDQDYDAFAKYAKTIPITYNQYIQTADAVYYKAYYAPFYKYGLVRTSGGNYATNYVFFHELRHRYGITDASQSHLTRDQLDGRSDLYSYIEDKFSVVHNALKFESGREDAKVWIFEAHSNILEGDYTNDGVMNYLAANYLKALIWYSCHSTEDDDTSKIRIVQPINIQLCGKEDNEEDNYQSTISKKNNNIKSKLIPLGNYQYLCEYYQNGIDFEDNSINNFVILRNVDIYNEIAYDKDIYLVDRKIYNQIKNSKTTDKICYPNIKNKVLGFSNSPVLFNNYGFSNLSDISYEIYSNEETMDLANIKCDKIRIYNPVIKKDLDFIVYIDNYINDIHFHYYCNVNSNLKRKVDKEIKNGNNRYIEYIEIKIPNISKLFNNDYFFKDEFNKIINADVENIFDYYEQEKLIDSANTSNNVYLNKLVEPYYVKDGKKIYINKKNFEYNNNVINTSLNITLYPYSGISNNIYMQSDINSITSFINHDFYFRLNSSLGFDNNTISVLNVFDFPNKIYKDNNYYDIDIHGDYTKQGFKDKYVNQVTKFYNTFYLTENIHELFDQEDFRDELDIENIRTTGFLIQMASDIDFKEIVFESVINTDNQNNNFIYDFSFSLDNIVNSWDQLNEILVIRTKFIDKRLNIVITGNNVVLTKEWFKYLINDTNVNHILFDKQNNLITSNFMDISQGYNFIDKINCIIKEEKSNNIDTSILNGNNTKIIYKPIFYKVQDLQNVKIRQGVTQKIGINLGEYMNKIDLFILNIEGNNIKETSRNDIYVIFEINANILEQNSGIYNILDDNFEYISSGNYLLY